MSAAPFEFPFTIPSSDLAAEYQHIHHAQTVRYLEMARLDLLCKLNFSMQDLIRSGLLLVVKNLTVDYKRELFAEPIVITCEAARMERRSVFINQRILKQNGKEAVVATVESMFLNIASRRAILPPESFSDKFLQYQKA